MKQIYYAGKLILSSALLLLCLSSSGNAASKQVIKNTVNDGLCLVDRSSPDEDDSSCPGGGCCRCPIGPPGPVGPPGPAGAAGPTGPAGPAGPGAAVAYISAYDPVVDGPVSFLDGDVIPFASTTATITPTNITNNGTGVFTFANAGTYQIDFGATFATASVNSAIALQINTNSQNPGSWTDVGGATIAAPTLNLAGIGLTVFPGVVSMSTQITITNPVTTNIRVVAVTDISVGVGIGDADFITISQIQ